MAITVTVSELSVTGNKQWAYGTIAFDSSYPDGGEAITARNCRMGVLDDIQLMPSEGRVFEFDKTNLKLLVYDAAVSEDLSGLSAVRFQAVGV